MTNYETTTILSAAFPSLESSIVAELGEIAKLRHFAAGTTIIERGEVANALYVLAQGAAHAVVLGKDGAWFDDPMGAGTVFGEMALLMGGNRQADVVADSDCVCLMIDYGLVRALMKRVPRVAGLLTILLGKRLQGREAIRQVGGFEIIGTVGSGGYARVFKARNTKTNEIVALKMLRHDLSWQDELAKGFRQEAHMLETLLHPGIVRFRGIVSAYATMFMVTDFVEGVDLDRYVDNMRGLPAPEVRSIFAQLAEALHFAHERGFVHLDVKPGNAIVGNDQRVRLLDFGIARPISAARKNESDEYAGTVMYSAPEQLLAQSMDQRTDLYALGITAYFMLTCLLPDEHVERRRLMQMRVSAEPFTRAELSDEVPEDFADLIYKCTRLRPEDRFESCRAALDFLRNAGGSFA